MTAYRQTPEYVEDLANLKDALQRIEQIRETFKDVITIPDVITIQDVSNITLDTTKGPQVIGAVCTRDEVVHILQEFQDNPCAEPALVAQYALDDYRQTHAKKKE